MKLHESNTRHRVLIILYFFLSLYFLLPLFHTHTHHNPGSIASSKTTEGEKEDEGEDEEGKKEENERTKSTSHSLCICHTKLNAKKEEKEKQDKPSCACASCTSCTQKQYDELTTEAEMLMNIFNMKKKSEKGKGILENAHRFCDEIEGSIDVTKHEDIERFLKESKTIFHVTYRNEEVKKLLKSKESKAREGEKPVVCVRIAECARGHLTEDLSIKADTSLFASMMRRYEEVTNDVIKDRKQEIILLEAHPLCIPVVGRNRKTIIEDPQNMWKMFSDTELIAMEYLTCYVRFQIALIQRICRVATIQPIGTYTPKGVMIRGIEPRVC